MTSRPDDAVIADRYSDVLDSASQLEEVERTARVRLAREQLTETHPDFNGRDCLDCGQSIPTERLAMQRIRCVHCQAAKERRKARGL